MVEKSSDISWKFDRTTTPWLRRVSYLVFGALGGLLVLGLLARLRYLQQGQYLRFLVLVAALVVGPAVVLGGLLYVRRVKESTDSPADTDRSEFRWYWVVVAAVGEGGIVYLVSSTGGMVGLAAVMTLFVLGFGGVFALNVLSTNGAIYPESGTLQLDDLDSTIELKNVRRFRTVRVGAVAIVWLVYEPGSYGFADPNTRRLVVVSPAVANCLETKFKPAR